MDTYSPTPLSELCSCLVICQTITGHVWSTGSEDGHGLIMVHIGPQVVVWRHLSKMYQSMVLHRIRELPMNPLCWGNIDAMLEIFSGNLIGRWLEEWSFAPKMNTDKEGYLCRGNTEISGREQPAYSRQKKH